MRVTGRFIPGGNRMDIAMAATIRRAIAAVIVEPSNNGNCQQVADYHRHRQTAASNPHIPPGRLP
jgi:hypothetical protein